MSKLEQAAQQALEALERAFFDEHTREDCYTAITTLREALAKQADEIDWIETNKALAKEIIELKKQAEQDPMKECRHCGFLCKPNSNESRKWYPLEQAEQWVKNEKK